MRAGFVLLSAIGAILASCNRPASSPHASRAPREIASNVLRADYAGSAACAKCHADVAAHWAASPMHNMTRTFDANVSRAPWSGTALRFKDDRVDLEERAGAEGVERIVHVRSARFGDTDYRVTRVIGGHHREDYAGVPLTGAPSADEVVLPISWLLWSNKFRYKGYSVMSRERPGVAAGPVWNRTCIFCHNTEPYFSDMLGALVQRKDPYQGELVDPLLPAGLREHVVIDDANALDGALGDEIEHLSHTRPTDSSTSDLALRAIETTRDHFTARDLVEVGIGCESCHGGSKAHAEDPSIRTSLAPHAAGFHFAPEPSDPIERRAERVNRACARCHQVLFSRYPFTWENGLRNGVPGGSHINSGEARDFIMSACSKRADCTLCHDPHATDNNERAKTLETPAGDAICTRCHVELASEPAARAHTHHDPRGAGGRCVACHMPKKNMTLDLELGRYHRIGSPNDPVKMLDRPLECALCHTDWSVEKIAGDMERLWGKRIDRAVLDGVYGALDANVIDATLEHGKAHEKAVALALLGEKRVARAAPAIARELVGPYPLVRFYAEHALERISGEPSPLDMYATDDEIRAAGEKWMASMTTK